MHIEFRLPTAVGGQSALYANTVLDRALTEWSIRYQCPFTKTLYHYRAHVELEREESYTVFALTWQLAQPSWQILQR